VQAGRGFEKRLVNRLDRGIGLRPERSREIAPWWLSSRKVGLYEVRPQPLRRNLCSRHEQLRSTQVFMSLRAKRSPVLAPGFFGCQLSQLIAFTQCVIALRRLACLRLHRMYSVFCRLEVWVVVQTSSAPSASTTETLEFFSYGAAS
jgi:hypothetical protein